MMAVLTPAHERSTRRAEEGLKMSTRSRLLLMCGMAALVLAAAPAIHDPVHAAASRQVVELSGPRVSVVNAARTVVTFEAKGDIRGLLTLTLLREGNAPVSGEWALVSRYVYDLTTGNADLGAGAEDAGYADSEKLAFAERGTIHGAVAGGTLGFNADGQLYKIDGLRLQIAGGNFDFEGALGNGSLSASSLQDFNDGAGTFVLAQEVK
jgi:hypothetical protein